MLVPIEIKAGQTLASDYFDAFARFAALAGELAAPGWVVYGGSRVEKRSAATALPWRSIDRLIESNL
jgi:hypothetical protein